jgi:hypothetical protein
MSEEGQAAIAPLTHETTIEIARAVADYWRKAALAWGDRPIPGSLMAHPLCCVLAALDGTTARPEDLGVEASSPEALRIEVAGYREAGAIERQETL